VVEAIGAALEPGGAILAVLVAGGIPTVLQDAVPRSGGRLLSDQRVHAVTLEDFLPQLRAAR
jgi:hypothetical protein